MRNRMIAAATFVAVALVVVTFVATRPERPRVLPLQVAAGTVLSVSQTIHAYSDPGKAGPPPIACDGSQAIPPRLLSDVTFTTSGPVVAPVAFTFGLHNATRTGGDAEGWVETVRTVSLPAGTSTQKGFVDQHFFLGVKGRLPAGIYFFKIRAGDAVHNCDFRWTG